MYLPYETTVSKHHTDRFWYERKHNNVYTKLYYKARNPYILKKEAEAMRRPSASFAGTQPDIEIRW